MSYKSQTKKPVAPKKEKEMMTLWWGANEPYNVVNSRFPQKEGFVINLKDERLYWRGAKDGSWLSYCDDWQNWRLKAFEKKQADLLPNPDITEDMFPKKFIPFFLDPDHPDYDPVKTKIQKVLLESANPDVETTAQKEKPQTPEKKIFSETPTAPLKTSQKNNVEKNEEKSVPAKRKLDFENIPVDSQKYDLSTRIALSDIGHSVNVLCKKIEVFGQKNSTYIDVLQNHMVRLHENTKAVKENTESLKKLIDQLYVYSDFKERTDKPKSEWIDTKSSFNLPLDPPAKRSKTVLDLTCEEKLEEDTDLEAEEDKKFMLSPLRDKN